MDIKGVYRYGRTVPVVSEPLAAVARLARAAGDDPHVVYEREGAWFFASGVLAEVRVTRDAVLLRHGGTEREEPWTDDPLAVVAGLLAELPFEGWRAYGWAGFDLAHANAGRPDLIRDDVLLHLVVPEAEVRIADGGAHVRAAAEGGVDPLADLVSAAGPTPVYRTTPVDVRHADADRYREAVARAVAEIDGTGLHKVILSRVVSIDGPVDLLGTFVEGRKANTPARSFLLRLPTARAAGFSPETVVEVDADGGVSTQPLAGTRALTGDPAEDAERRETLANDPKEVFEHAISVRESQTEMASVCAPGSVVVSEFMAVRERGTVQHLASRVSGRLADGAGPWAAFRELFPAITASGVPKRLAYDCIADNEECPRGMYSGAVLAVDADGSLDATLVLRAVYTDGTHSWLRAGAGIVGDSTPERELEETREKLLSVARGVVFPEAADAGTRPAPAADKQFSGA